MKKTLLILLILIISVSFAACAQSQGESQSQFKAKVISATDESYQDEETGNYYSDQQLTIELLEGPFAGQQAQASVFIDAANYTDIILYRVDDTVITSVFLTDSGTIDHVSVVSLYRVPYIIILAAIFLVLIGIIGRKKGLKTILALVFTVSAVVFALVPLIANGYDPILSAALVCIAVSVVTLFTVGGFNKKALSAVLGTIGGLICAATITLIFSGLMRITGIDTGTVGLLMVADTDVSLDYQGILTAGILIGCIGAVMDVGMSISSAINELVVIDKTLSRKQLFRSGLSVGKDIIGTMANTLILAYTGGSLMLMIVWSVYDISFADMLNKGFIVIEVAKSLCGSIGMVMSIPLTAFIASHLVRHDFHLHHHKTDQTDETATDSPEIEPESVQSEPKPD